MVFGFAYGFGNGFAYGFGNGFANGFGNGIANGSGIGIGNANANSNVYEMYYATEIYNIQSTSEIILYTRKNEARQRNKATAFETPRCWPSTARHEAEEAKQRRTRRQGAGWARRRRLRPLLLASTTKSAHTGAGATPRNWLPAGTDGPSTEQR